MENGLLMVNGKKLIMSDNQYINLLKNCRKKDNKKVEEKFQIRKIKYNGIK